MSSEETRNSKVFDKYQNLFRNEIMFSIFTTIELYGSLNLRKIAKLMDKPEPTVYRHLKQLLDEDFLVLDSEKSTLRKGKFYILSAPFQSFSDNYFTNTTDSENIVLGNTKNVLKIINEGEINEFRKKNLKRLAALLEDYSYSLELERLNVLTNKIQTSIINSFKIHEEKVKTAVKTNRIDEFIENEEMISNIGLDIYLLRTTKIEHTLKLSKLLLDFSNGFFKLKQEIEKEIKSNKTPEEECFKQYVSVFSGFIDSKVINE